MHEIQAMINNALCDQCKGELFWIHIYVIMVVKLVYK